MRRCWPRRAPATWHAAAAGATPPHLPGFLDGRLHLAHTACDRPVNEVQVQVIQAQGLRSKGEQRAELCCGHHLEGQATLAAATESQHESLRGSAARPSTACLAYTRPARPLSRPLATCLPALNSPPPSQLGALTFSDLRHAWRTRAAEWLEFLAGAARARHVGRGARVASGQSARCNDTGHR